MIAECLNKVMDDFCVIGGCIQLLKEKDAFLVDLEATVDCFLGILFRVGEWLGTINCVFLLVSGCKCVQWMFPCFSSFDIDCSSVILLMKEVVTQ